jgi:hypothetical protein
MSYTVAQQLIETLKKAGVERIYGIVGDSLNPITDAIRRDKKIQWCTSVMKRPQRSRPGPKLSSPDSWRSAREAAVRAICI